MARYTISSIGPVPGWTFPKTKSNQRLLSSSQEFHQYFFFIGRMAIVTISGLMSPRIQMVEAAHRDDYLRKCLLASECNAIHHWLSLRSYFIFVWASRFFTPLNSIVYDWRLGVVGLGARLFARETAKAMPTDETEVSRCVFWNLHSVAIGVILDSFTRLQSYNLYIYYLYFNSPKFDVEHYHFHFR